MSNVTASHAAYRRGTVLAATPAQLVVLLYDGAHRFLRQGANAMRDGDVVRAHNTLRRGERIISHLDGTLDFEQGEVSQSLHAIYLFCLSHLNAARMSQDPGQVEEVAELLGDLRDAWNQIASEVDDGVEIERA